MLLCKFRKIRFSWFVFSYIYIRSTKDINLHVIFFKDIFYIASDSIIKSFIFYIIKMVISNIIDIQFTLNAYIISILKKGLDFVVALLLLCCCCVRNCSFIRIVVVVIYCIRIFNCCVYLS